MESLLDAQCTRGVLEHQCPQHVSASSIYASFSTSQLPTSGNSVQSHSVYRQCNLSRILWRNFFLISLDSFLLYCSHSQIIAASSAPNSDFCLLHSAGPHDLFGLHCIAHGPEICPQGKDSIESGTAFVHVHSLKDHVLALAVV